MLPLFGFPFIFSMHLTYISINGKAEFLAAMNFSPAQKSTQGNKDLDFHFVSFQEKDLVLKKRGMESFFYAGKVGMAAICQRTVGLASNFLKAI